MATAFMVLSISIAKGMIGEDESSEAVLELPAAVNTNASGTSSEHSADTSSPVASDGVEPSGPPPSVPESAPKIDGDGSEPVGPPPALIEPDGDITAL